MSLESDGVMIYWQGKPSATLSATNPTWIDPGANPGLRGVRPTPNDLRHGIALNRRIIYFNNLSYNRYFRKCFKLGYKNAGVVTIHLHAL
jgi:hypothetical protein